MSTVKTYELSFLALPHKSDEEVQAMQSTVADAIGTAGGQVASLGDVHFIPLAYEMTKKVGSKNTRYNEAYFTWLKFSLPTEQVATVEETVAANLDVLRYMIITTTANDAVTNSFTMDLGDEEADEEATDSIVAEVAESEDEDELPHEKLPETNVSVDDLTVIEGVGPVIATTLENAGIATYADLAEAAEEKLSELLEGVRGNHDPATWAEQAALARDGKWDELKELQDRLMGGREE